jgi:hypothetical protein
MQLSDSAPGLIPIEEIMRILRGLRGETLACGCSVGVYETYSGEIIMVLDYRHPACAREHATRKTYGLPSPHREATVEDRRHTGS